jgi:tRNA1(Val) A37 N6-methylase TrmN6
LKNSIAIKKQELFDFLNGKAYEYAFEWRFEFPELLDDDGNFIGFDIVIGNPPYVSTKNVSVDDKKIFLKIYGFSDDTYAHFFFRGFQLLNDKGMLNYISPKTFWTTQTKRNLRELLLSKKLCYIFDTASPFKEAMVDTCITAAQNFNINNNEFIFYDGNKDLADPKIYTVAQSIYQNTQNSVIFKPTPENIKIHELYGKKVKELYNKW